MQSHLWLCPSHCPSRPEILSPLHLSRFFPLPSSRSTTPEFAKLDSAPLTRPFGPCPHFSMCWPPGLACWGDCWSQFSACTYSTGLSKAPISACHTAAHPSVCSPLGNQTEHISLGLPFLMPTELSNLSTCSF